MDNEPRDTRFTRQLQTHYLKQQLSEQQLMRLKQLQTNQSNGINLYLSAVAASTFIAVSLYYFSFSAPDYAAISEQIAYNHNSKLQMEVLSPTMSGVQDRLNRLGFSLVSSSKLKSGNWQLVGGRYCNINGKLAAQMQLTHPETKATYTFYQAKMSKELLDNFSETETAIDGVKVKLWREKGLMMGLAF